KSQARDRSEPVPEGAKGPIFAVPPALPLLYAPQEPRLGPSTGPEKSSITSQVPSARRSRWRDNQTQGVSSGRPGAETPTRHHPWGKGAPFASMPFQGREIAASRPDEVHCAPLE